ncbi:MAG: SpoIIE family protein phosphatase [Burkholderiales bacterium]|nr:SpoIIE family protein phosphatase [Burkholderiales bacterium]
MDVKADQGRARLNALVIDGSPSHAAYLCAILQSAGHQALHAADGEAGLKIYADERPDLVLLDLHMPGMGGRECARLLRAADPARWVPIWFVTASRDPEEIGEAIAAGADALIPKPVSEPILRAQIANAARYTMVNRQMQNQIAELQNYHDTSEEENRTAREIMKKLLTIQSDHGKVLKVWNAPAFKFSGDIVMAERSPDGSFKVLLADGVGHGLTAALNVLPLGRAFQAMAHKGFGLPALVTELNNTIRRDLPSHRFVAATLINVDVIEDRIEVWNGGNPPCLILDAAGCVLARCESRHLPLGVVAGEEIDAQPEIHPFIEEAQIVACSDGIVEAFDGNGRAFGESGLTAALAQAAPEARFEAARMAVVEHLAGESAADDVTLALIDCTAEAARRRRSGEATTAVQKLVEAAPLAPRGDWELRLRVGAERLKRIEVVPILQEFLARFDPVGALDKSTFVVLSELFNNALDHGLLELDSGLKAESNGLQAYTRERERRLNALTDGAIAIDIARVETDTGTKLRVRVKDSGKGFDSKAWKLDAASLFRRTDRGINLVEKLCESVEYMDNGSEIVVTRALPPMAAMH